MKRIILTLRFCLLTLVICGQREVQEELSYLKNGVKEVISTKGDYWIRRTYNKFGFCTSFSEMGNMSYSNCKINYYPETNKPLLALIIYEPDSTDMEDEQPIDSVYYSYNTDSTLKEIRHSNPSEYKTLFYYSGNILDSMIMTRRAGKKITKYFTYNDKDSLIKLVEFFENKKMGCESVTRVTNYLRLDTIILETNVVTNFFNCVMPIQADSAVTKYSYDLSGKLKNKVSRFSRNDVEVCYEYFDNGLVKSISKINRLGVGDAKEESTIYTYEFW